MNYQKYFESIEFSRGQTRQRMFDLERTWSAPIRATDHFFADAERNRWAMRDVERTLSAPIRVAEPFFAAEERNRQATLDLERTWSAPIRATDHFFAAEERNRWAMRDVERTLSAPSRVVDPLFADAERNRQRMLFEREKDEETIKELRALQNELLGQCFLDREVQDSESDESQVKRRVVDAVCSLTTAICFELIMFRISGRDQQLIYLMEKIKDLPGQEILKVLEEIYKILDGFLL